MKKNFHSVRGPALLALLVLLGAGCEYKVPKSVWDPNADLGAFPTITTVIPEGRAGGGAKWPFAILPFAQAAFLTEPAV